MDRNDKMKIAFGAAALGVGFYELNKKYKWEKEYREWGKNFMQVRNGDKIDDNDVTIAEESKKMMPNGMPMFWFDEKKTVFFNYWLFLEVQEKYIKAIKNLPKSEWDSTYANMFADQIKRAEQRPLIKKEIEQIVKQLQIFSDHIDNIRIEVAEALRLASNELNFDLPEKFNETHYSNAFATLDTRHAAAKKIAEDLKKEFHRYSPEFTRSISKQIEEIDSLKLDMRSRIDKQRASHRKAFDDKLAAVKRNAELFHASQKKLLEDNFNAAKTAMDDATNAMLGMTTSLLAVEGWEKAEGTATEKDYEYKYFMVGGKSERFRRSNDAKSWSAEKMASSWREYDELPEKQVAHWQGLNPKRIEITEAQYSDPANKKYDPEKKKSPITGKTEITMLDPAKIKTESAKPRIVKHTSGGWFSSSSTEAEFIPRDIWDNMLEKSEWKGSKFKNAKELENGVGGLPIFGNNYSVVQSAAAYGLPSKISALKENLPDMEHNYKYLKEKLDFFNANINLNNLKNHFGNAMNIITRPASVLDSLQDKYRDIVNAEAVKMAQDYLKGLGINAIASEAIKKASEYGKDVLAYFDMGKLTEKFGELSNIISEKVPLVKQAYMLIVNASEFFSSCINDFRNIAKGFQGDYVSCYKGIDGLYEKFLGAGTILGTIVRAIPVVGQVFMVYDALKMVPGFEHLAGAAIGSVANTLKTYWNSMTNFATSLNAGNIGGALYSYFALPAKLMVATWENLKNLAEGVVKMAGAIYDWVKKTWGKVFAGAWDELKSGDILGAMNKVAQNLKRMAVNLLKDIGNAVYSTLFGGDVSYKVSYGLGYAV